MIRLLLAAALALWAAAAPAQDATDWDALAERAQGAIERGVASDDALQALRAELVAKRAAARAGEAENAARIGAVRARLADLGPIPDGEAAPEAPDIAARRAELEAELDVLLAPVREAEARAVEAEVLIAELDALIEGRRREALFLQEGTPLDPRAWLAAGAALGAWGAAAADDIAAPATTEVGRANLRANLVEVWLLTVLAFVLVWRSRVWLKAAQGRLAGREADSPRARLALSLADLGQVVLPIAGLVATVRLLRLAGVDGPAVEPLLATLPLAGAMPLIGRWLGRQAFPPRLATFTVLPLPAERRMGGRRLATLLGGLAGVLVLLDGIASADPDVAAVASVLHFALIVAGGLALARLGRLLLLRPHAAEGGEAEAPSERGFWGQVLAVIGRLAVVAGIAAPVLGAVGYVNAGAFFLWPFVATLALMALVGWAQNLIFDMWATAAGREGAGRDALGPTLVAFALGAASLPLLAVIWGVRVETLGDWWFAFLDGVPLGETRVSPAAFLTFAAVFAIGYALTRLVQSGLRNTVLPKTRLDAGGTNAILSGTGYVGVFLAALVAITSAGIDLSGLAIVAGALSVGVGFGLQTIVQNFVSGIILLIERPIKIGDWINVGGTEGFVRGISVRSTRIETFDRQDVIVPNADLISQPVINYTLANSAGRVLVPVGVAYGSDTRRVQAIIEEVCQAHPMVVLNPPPLVTFEGFGADSLDFLARCVLRDVLWRPVVGSEIRHALAERFKEEGLEVPFRQQDVWLRNPEALRGAVREDG